jgi:hypothetical protein
MRILVVEGGGKIELYGDPVKAVASLLIFNNSSVKGWVRGKGLEVEAAPETWEALKALSANPPNPLPQRLGFRMNGSKPFKPSRLLEVVS